ncbi:hypothetical protein GJ496_006279 [Pomphorhynchus laevis]|nr:hypothetical protein GJ496_006279 [Pomphorhynchus laevis]
MTSNNNLRFLNSTLPRSAQSFSSINKEVETSLDNLPFSIANIPCRGSYSIGLNSNNLSRNELPLFRKINHFQSTQDLSKKIDNGIINNKMSVNNPIINNGSTSVRLRDKFTVRDENYLRKIGRQPNNFSLTISSHPNLSASSSQVISQSQSYKNIISANSDNVFRVKSEPQRIFVIRHGERVDSTFGLNWIDVVFDNNGKYRRINLNLPRVIPQRKNPKDFLFDPPLTEIGLVHSKLIGEELEACKTHIKYCYCSPALRCIQTATKILEGMKRTDIAIRIEPCLFEFLKWHPVMPLKSPFMDMDELRNNGFHIDTSYKTVYPLESLRKDEDETMYYTRSHTVMLQIIRNHDNKSSSKKTDNEADKTEDENKQPDNILIVAHAPTLEVATRQLTGGNPRISDLKFLVRQIPYLSIQAIERQSESLWKFRKPPIPPMKHGAVEPFDWRHLR